MRSGFTISLIVTMLFSSGYFYYVAQAICPVPIEYQIGELDERFNLSKDEAKLAIAEAESVWEDATGQNLFTYRDDARFVVNFIYDERQALTDMERIERAKLSTVESVSDEVRSEYNRLILSYDEQQRSHEARVAAYEQDLQDFNDKVDAYNQSGGAPEEVFEELQAEENRLDQEREAINSSAGELNDLVQEINRLGERGNNLVERYNERVSEFNDAFSTHREFTQGTYTNQGAIDIYTFADETELQTVLAHELGHALSIGHVPGAESVMYYLIGGQPEELTLSEYDMAAFVEVCGSRSFWDTISLGVNQLFYPNL